LDTLAECFGEDAADLPASVFPLTYKFIAHEQQTDKSLLKRLSKSYGAPSEVNIASEELIQALSQASTASYHTKSFRGGGTNHTLICHKDKIVIPSSLQNRVVEWYHTYLLHPGVNRTEETIRQHLWWPNMRDDIKRHIGTCDICQKYKKHNQKYGLLPEKEAEAEPWDRLCVDLIGPYTIRRKGKQPLRMQCCTMIDPATGWFEIAQYDDKRAITIANVVEQYWLTRYPWPTRITFDRGSEFIGHEFKRMIKEDYGIKAKPITVRNPQANAIVERVHQTIGNMIKTFQLEDNYLDEDDPWAGILSATAFAVRSTYHTTLQATPGQLVFGRDMILNIQHTANWKAIKDRKQQIIKKNNLRENRTRIPHTYRRGEKVLLRRDGQNKYERPWDGPYKILQVNTNGTVRLRIGAVADTVNIRRIHPYKSDTSNRGGECNMPP